MKKVDNSKAEVKPVLKKIPTKYDDRKTKFKKLSKNNELNEIRLKNDYMDNVLQHSWLIDNYIAKFGLVSEDAPENTIKAYKNAIKKGYPILIQVQLLDDGEIVCFNGKVLSTTTKASGYLTKMSLDEIKEIKIGESQESIPTLQEALDAIAGKVPVVIDINNDGTVGKFEQKVADMLDDYIVKHNLFDSVAVMSLNPYTLEWFMAQAPWFPRILRSGKFKVKNYGSIKAKHLTKLKLFKIALPDFICYNAKDLPCRYVKRVKPVCVIAYNVRNQQEYIDVAKYCDNIVFTGFEPSI